MEIDGLGKGEVVVDATDPVAGVGEQVARMNILGSTTPGRGPKMVIKKYVPRYGCPYEETEVMFLVEYAPDGCEEMIPTSDLVCMCGDTKLVAPYLHVGVYWCLIPPQPPGRKVTLQLSFDGEEPISQAVTFESFEFE